MMRVLHILDHSLPLQSGYVYRTLGIVEQQRRLGWEPILLTSRPPNSITGSAAKSWPRRVELSA